MSVYYQDYRVTLHHGDCWDLLGATSDRSVDCVITDPPFDSRTHAMARTNKRGALGGRSLSGTSNVRFGSWDHGAQMAFFAEAGRVTRAWVVSTLAMDTAFRFEVDQPPAGLRVLRIGAWVKTDPMPILSADRPAMGWEPIAYMHRDDAKPTWNGGGRAGNYVLPTSKGSGHPTQKPLAMVQDWVRRFTNPGDLILDPCAGTGTTVRAAIDEGRRVIACDNDERWCEHMALRLAQDCLDLGSLA